MAIKSYTFAIENFIFYQSPTVGGARCLEPISRCRSNLILIGFSAKNLKKTCLFNEK